MAGPGPQSSRVSLGRGTWGTGVGVGVGVRRAKCPNGNFYYLLTLKLLSAYLDRWTNIQMGRRF